MIKYNEEYPTPDGAYGIDSNTIIVRKTVRNRVDKRGLTKVIIEVQKHTYTGNGKYDDAIRRVSTNTWINPKNWNKKRKVVKSREPDFETKNKVIDTVYMEVKKFVDSKGQQRPEDVYVEKLDIKNLIDFFPARKENKKCLHDYINDYIKFRKDEKTPRGTLKEFVSMQNRLKAYDNYKGRKTHFEDINLSWADGFASFLFNIVTHKREGIVKTGYHSSTVGKTFTILVTVLNHFYNRRKELQIKLSDDFKIKSTTGSQNGFKRGSKAVNDANPLNREQLRALYHHNFEPLHLQKTKDRFLWQCYTGMRYVDAFTITKSMIVQGKGWLRFEPSKTNRYNTKVEQPLSPVALDLLKKYDNDITQLKITNQAYNRDLSVMFSKLKEEYPELNYQTDYGSYASRDTFISMAVQGHADWKSILLWVGQKSYTIMDRYIKIEDKTQVKMINDIFSKPK